MTDYADLRRYLAAVQANAASPILPLQMVAKHLGVSRAAVDQMLRVPEGRRQLKAIKIGTHKFVDAKSVIALDDARARDMAKVRAYLERVVRRGERSVFYEPVMAEIGRSPQIPADRGYIGHVLGEISETTHRESRTLLSVLVHRKSSGRTRPGPGFFNLASKLGYSWDDDDTLVEKETNRAIARYSPGRR